MDMLILENVAAPRDYVLVWLFLRQAPLVILMCPPILHLTGFP